MRNHKKKRVKRREVSQKKPKINQKVGFASCEFQITVPMGSSNSFFGIVEYAISLPGMTCSE